MDIRIKTTDYQLAPETSAYLDEKLSAIERLLGGDAATTRVEVEIARAAGNQRHGEHLWKAEINVFIPGGQQVRATNHADNVNTAIDDAQEEIVKQMRREKRVHRTFLRASGAALKRLMRFGSED